MFRVCERMFRCASPEFRFGRLGRMDSFKRHGVRRYGIRLRLVGIRLGRRHGTRLGSFCWQRIRRYRNRQRMRRWHDCCASHSERSFVDRFSELFVERRVKLQRHFGSVNARRHGGRFIHALLQFRRPGRCGFCKCHSISYPDAFYQRYRNFHDEF